METIVIVLAVALVLVFFGAIAVLGFMLYHQMLLVNEVNKRLLLMAKDSMDKVNTQNDEILALQEELTQVRIEFQEGKSVVEKATLPEVDKPFDPHGFDVGGLEDN